MLQNYGILSYISNLQGDLSRYWISCLGRVVVFLQKTFCGIWLSIILTLSVPRESNSINTSCLPN